MGLPEIAFIAGGRLHLKQGDAPVVSCTSAFAEQVRGRHAEIHQRHSWKSEGRGARFMSGLLWGAPERDPSLLRLAITSLTRGAAPGEVLYSMDVEGRSAVCVYRAFDGSERRLLHGAPQHIRDLDSAPDGLRVACSVLHADGTSSIAVMTNEATDVRELTEGDVQDRSPSWVRGCESRIVYQSAGVGRDASGRPADLGPSEIHSLDTDTGALETLAADSRYDFLSPRLDADGALVCLRRPRRRRTATLGASLLDFVLFPARLLYAVFQYLNFFTTRYTGKPLTTAGGPKREGADLRQMMVWSNLMQAEAPAADEPPSSVPRDWQLVRIVVGGRPEVLASGVLAFDLGRDGSLVYSTGSAIHHVSPGGERRRLLSEERIEALIALS